MAEDNFNINEENGSEELFESLNEAYNSDVNDFKTICGKDALKHKLDCIANTKAVFRKVYEEHRGDGDYVSLVLGSVAGKALANNLLAILKFGGVGPFIANLVNSATMPMVAAWQAEFEREDIEREIEELDS